MEAFKEYILGFILMEYSAAFDAFFFIPIYLESFLYGIHDTVISLFSLTFMSPLWASLIFP